MNEEIIKDIKKHEFYLKPGQKKRVKSAEARKRAAKARSVRRTVNRISIARKARRLSILILVPLLPGGRPRLCRVSFGPEIQAGGRPRRFPWRCARRSSAMIAS